MFKLHKPSTAAQIYAHSLKQLSLGRALWYPEPHDTGEPQVGDVGYLSDGAFVRLFNLDTSDATKKVTYWEPRSFVVDEELPEGALKIDRRRQPLARGEYSSNGVEKIQVHASADVAVGPNVSVGLSAEYSCKATFGAVLELKSDPHAQTIYENTELKDYILRNHGKWHAYVTDVLKQPVKGRDLVMISGWVKTEANWAAAAFASTHASSSASVSGQAGGVAAVDAGAERATSVTGPTMHRHGEAYLEASADAPAQPRKDQCVFVKRYKVRHRMAFLRKIVAGAGDHHLPRGGGGGSSGEMEAGTSEEEHGRDEDEGDNVESAEDPVDVLLQYIFEISSVDVAVASDDDVEAITGGKWIVDLSSYLREVRPPVAIAAVGVGCFDIDDVIRHKCLRYVLLGTRDRRSRLWVDAEDGITSRRYNTFKAVRGRIETSLYGGRPVLLPALALKDPGALWKGGPTFLAVSPDKKYIAAGFGRYVMLFRANDRKPLHRLRLETRGLEVHLDHPRLIRDLGDQALASFLDATYLKFSPDGRSLACVWQALALSISFVVMVWDVQSGCASPVRITWPGWVTSVTAIAWDASRDRIALAVWDSDRLSITIWGVANGDRQSIVQLPPEFKAWTVSRMEFVRNSMGNDRLCFGSGGLCHIYDLETSSLVSSIPASSHFVPIPPPLRPAGVRSRHGGCLLSEVKEGEMMMVRDAYTGDELLRLSHTNPLILPAEISPDGAEVLVTCHKEHAVLTYELQTGKLLHVYQVQGEAARGAYSPDGRFLAVALMSGEIKVYSPRTTELLLTIEGPQPPNFKVARHHFIDDMMYTKGYNLNIRDALVETPIDHFVFLADGETLLVERVDDTHLINIADALRMRV